MTYRFFKTVAPTMALIVLGINAGCGSSDGSEAGASDGSMSDDAANGESANDVAAAGPTGSNPTLAGPSTAANPTSASSSSDGDIMTGTSSTPTPTAPGIAVPGTTTPGATMPPSGAVAAGGSSGVGTMGGMGAVSSIGATGSTGTMGATGASSQGDDASEPDPSTPPPAEVVQEFANPFTMANFDPLSTFAADVDTASYDAFRQYAAAGQVLQGERVRIEEWVNYFEYDYEMPAADSETPFSVQLAAAPGLSQYETTMLRVAIQGKAAPNEEPKPANLVFLIDTSGSMTSAEKLPLVKTLLLETLDVLDQSDTLSIVTYAGNTEVALEPTLVSERATIQSVINGLGSGGSTAGAAGLTLAYQQAEAGYIEDGINHIVLCTDGDFNVGPSSNTELLALIEDKRETGVTLTALGFGYNNDSMMELVSNAGNGVYGIITDADQAIEYANERMLSTLHHIAKDMKIQVEFNPELVQAYRLIGYDNRAIADQDFRNDTVDAGEIGAGHRVTAFYEVVLAGGTIPEPEGAPAIADGEAYTDQLEIAAEDLVMVKVRYKEPGATTDDPAAEVSASLAPADVAASAADEDADFQWALAVAAYAELLRGSPYIDAVVLDAVESIVSSSEYADDEDRAEFAELFVQTRSML